MDQSAHIIIAKYQEDTRWTENLPSFYHMVIYDKHNHLSMNFLPNIGREAHTYLYHIVNNYHNLSDIMVFCQGNPFDHYPSILQKLSDQTLLESIYDSSGFFGLGPQVSEGPYANFDPRHEMGLPMFYFLNLLFGINMQPKDVYRTVYGAQFITTKKNIVHRPIGFYKLVLDLLSTENIPIEAYILERLWPYIFDTNYKLSPKILKLVEKYSN